MTAIFTPRKFRDILHFYLYVIVCSCMKSFGRLFVKRFALCYRTHRCPVSLTVLSVCNVGVLWPKWLKMKLGMEVGLGPGDIALDGDPAPPTKGGRNSSPHVGPCIWPNSLMDQDASWYKDMPGPWLHPAPPERGTAASSPSFRPMSIVAKRSPISATPEHLYCML